ncbi:MAG: NUDIX domain-containing protein [Solirubrobacteraceae bacterium]
MREITTLLPPGSDGAAEKSICLCVLRVGDSVALQLRDDRPDIHNPNCWGLFGGALKEGETPEQTVVREIEEETTVRLDSPRRVFSLRQEFNAFHGCSVCLHVFEADVTEAWPSHLVLEGQRSGLRTREETQLIPNLTPIARDILRTYFEEYAPA